ncbi:MAG: class I SAM-dependent methyltransferase [Pseudomonadota bacterium]
MTDRKTIDVYDARAADYAARFGAPRPDPRLDAFIAALPAGGHVLDLGCGPGKAAAVMVAAGLQVTALDASAEMARLAREQHGIEVTVAGFDAIEGEALFDGVWASFSLLHAEREDMPRHLAALHRALKPGGRLMLGLKRGAGTHRDGIGRRYTFYETEDLAPLLATAGFTVTETELGEEAGLDGTVSPWIITHAHA